MTPNFVADVGNTRIKWGRCGPDGVDASVSLAPDDPAGWEAQRRRWPAQRPAAWVVTGVHPERRDRLADWLRQQGDTVTLLDGWRQLPLRVALEHPERVGIDRLLNAVAANARRHAERPAVVIDAGSAVTVDFVDVEGAFRGGAIFPGLRLMARALHEYTALLPLVGMPDGAPVTPGDSTTKAIEAGVFWAVVGGVRELVERLVSRGDSLTQVFLTGGDAALLAPHLDPSVALCPHLTLEGVRHSAAGLVL